MSINGGDNAKTESAINVSKGLGEIISGFFLFA